MSTNFQIGFISQKNSSKISKPPGGGSSNFFSDDDVLTTPRSVKNHMKSNIFGTPPNVNNVADTRRPRHDSHARLFGEVERQFPGSEKNYMKSSIPINNAKSTTASNENENTNEQRDNRKIEDSIKKSLDDHDSMAHQIKSAANKNRVPPGGFSSILW